ncbi:MAG: uracil-DNA glycosylase family protein [Verrucomicrobiae bacterium]
MSDPFQQALHATLPMLKKIQHGIKPAPKGSTSALKKLRDAALAGCPPGQAAAPPQSTPGTGAAKRPAAQPANPPIAPAVPAGGWTMESLRKAVLACEKCPHLVRSRTQVVFGVGNPGAELLFVGEAPGADEDAQGEPFVGKAGQLLTKIIQAMGFERSDIFIANVLKCRPDMPPGESGNRKPKPAEMATCLPWLVEQIALIKPRVIVALGATAVEGLLGETSPLRDLRGRWLEFQGTPVMVTYHPAYLLRNQSLSEKRKVWEDMLLVLEKLEKKITAKQRAFFTKASG